MKIKIPDILCAALFLVMAGSHSFVFAEYGERTRVISAEDFYLSDAGQLFENGEFGPAAAAIDDLIKKYPGDMLLIRYKAMALDLGGDSEQAIELFQDLLIEYPEHIPTHFFLGNAYARAGRMEDAREQWQWVVENGAETFYEASAQGSLEQ